MLFGADQGFAGFGAKHPVDPLFESGDDLFGGDGFLFRIARMRGGGEKGQCQDVHVYSSHSQD